MKQNLSADLTFDLLQQPIGNGRRYCKIQYNDTGTGSYPLPVKVPSPVLLGVGARSRCRCSRHSVTKMIRGGAGAQTKSYAGMINGSIVAKHSHHVRCNLLRMRKFALD